MSYQMTDEVPTCGVCGIGMRPENSTLAPELFLCDKCANKEGIVAKPLHVSAETELADLRAKLDAARVAIKKAPHTLYCPQHAVIPNDQPCTCWKSAALAQIDTTISPPDTQSKNT